jgi:hypothetical protein
MLTLIKNVIEELMDKLHTQKIAMTNIRPKNTGLPMTIWVQPFTGKERHGPRIKVQTEHGEKVQNSNWVSVTVEDNPQLIGKLDPADFKLVKEFVLKNKVELLRLWNDEIDPIEFVAHIEKV